MALFIAWSVMHVPADSSPRMHAPRSCMQLLVLSCMGSLISTVSLRSGTV